MLLFENDPLNKSFTASAATAFFLLPFILMPLSSYAESFTAKRIGQGFTGLTQDFTSSLSNPALLTKFDNDEDVFFSLNLGIMISDKYNVIDTTEDISNNLEQLSDDINSIHFQDLQYLNKTHINSNNLNQQVDDIVADFKSIDKKIVKVRNGVNFQVLIPNKYLSFGIFTSQYGRVSGTMDYNEGDEKKLNEAILVGELDLNELESATLAVGYSVAEAGFMTAYSAVDNANYELSVGAKLKYQRIELYYKRVVIADFDDDFEITDDQDTTDESGTNVDLGLYVSWGEERQWHAALVTNNLIKQKVHHIEEDIIFTLESSVTFGLSYQNSWVSLATDIDLTDREKFTSLEPSKYAGVGAEFRFYDHIQFRLGYRTDLNDNDDDIYTAGIGISPWDVFAIDIAAFTGDNDTLGTALQFSLKI
jgi:hypothetical protein